MAWYDSNWGRRLKITSDNTKVASSVKGLALDLSTITSDDFWDYVDSDGADIRITESDGETELARDVISIDTTAKTGLIRFDTSGISTSSDTDFYIYFDNSSASEPSPSDTYGQYNAYDSNLKAYYPHAEGTGTTLYDYSENDNDGTINGATWSEMNDGLYALDYDGSSDYTEWTDASFIDKENSGTIKMWINPNTLTTANFRDNPFFYSNQGSGSAERFYGAYDHRSGNRRLVFGYGSGSIEWDTTLSTDTWYFLTFTWDNLNIKLYVGGIERASGTVGSVDMSDSVDDLLLARYLDSYFDGEITNVMVANEAFSSNDIETIHNNESDNSAFWTIGGVEEGTVTLNLEETFSSSDGDILIANRLFSETIDSDDDITNTPDYVPFVIKGKVSRGSGVENAKVYLYNQSTGVIDATETTDANGDYIFNDLDRDVKYSVGCVEYEESGEKYNEKTFYDIEAKSQYESKETFTFEGASESDSKYTRTLDEGTYEIEVHGADGGDADSDRVGGSGGYIKGKFDASQGDEIEIWVGQRGKDWDDPDAFSDTVIEGGWGKFEGGDGANNQPSAQQQRSGAGGGSTEVLIIDNTPTGGINEYSNTTKLAIADAGGGAGSSVSGTGGSGGGGGRCGDAGTPGDNGVSGEDAECPNDGIGFGGDGGNDDADGEDGGQEAGSSLYDVIETTGGSDTDDGHGKVILRKLI